MTQPADAFAPGPIDGFHRVRWSPDAMAEAIVLAERWHLDLVRVVGAAEVPPGGLGTAALHRIGALVGIDRGLIAVLGQDQGREWLHAANAGPGFGGRSPAAMMERGGLAGLLLVRSTLDAARGGMFAGAGDAGEPVRLSVLS
jgi:hypothetical protein